MDAKEATTRAKEHILDIFGEEGLADIGIESAVRTSVQGRDSWQVTISFTRPWNRRGNLASIMRESGGLRAYKAVAISNEDGTVLSLTDGAREPVA